MPQEPQQVDLEEMTRLRELAQGNVSFRGMSAEEQRFYAAISNAFPALRDELAQSRQFITSLGELIHFPCSAEVIQEETISLIKALRAEHDKLRDELVRLREEREQWRLSSVCRELRRQLDEAKGLLEAHIKHSRGLLSYPRSPESSARIIKQLDETRAFLASLNTIKEGNQ